MSFLNLIRRLLARSFDMNIAGILFLAGLFGSIMYSVGSPNIVADYAAHYIESYAGYYDSLKGFDKLVVTAVGFLIIGIFSSVSSFIIEAIGASIWGRGLGKVIFGIRVKNSDGHDAELSHYLKRSALAWIVGCGLLLPYLDVLCAVVSAIIARRHGTSWWDKKTDTYEEFVPCRWWQFVLQVIVYFIPVIVAVTVFTAILIHLYPKN